MDGLTINQAAETTGWSPRMLRYIESAGLIEPARNSSGYRLYGAAELQRLRSDPELSAAVERWFEERATRPEGVESNDWLRWEQEKHERLLALTDKPRLTETPA